MDYTIFPKKTDLLRDARVIGHVTCPFTKLVELFNQPFLGDGKDTDVEWHILLDNGHPISIYNYRNGKAYNGSGGADSSEITIWNVKGHYEYDFSGVKELLEGKKFLDFNAHLKAKDKDNLVKRLRGIADHIEDGSMESSNNNDYHSWTLEEKSEENYPQA